MAEADRQGLNRLAMLVLGCFVSTVLIVGVLILAAIQAVSIIDGAGTAHEVVQVARAVAAAPSINGVTVDAIATSLDLDHARLTTLAGVQQGEVSVAAVPGADIVLAWRPHLFGYHTFEMVAPIRIAAGILFVGIVAILGWNIHANGRIVEARRAEAERLALTDGLTGLANRMAFDRALEARSAAAAEFALALLDLDDFKGINDRHGHAAGDRVLKAVAERLRLATGEGDVVARIGGDEFAIIRRTAGLGEFLIDLPMRLAAPIEAEGARLEIGISFGVGLSADHPGSPSELTRAADVALYRAKRGEPDSPVLSAA